MTYRLESTLTAMKALLFDDTLHLTQGHPEPPRRDGWATIAVTKAGICRTDLELVKGYMGFKGVLGHEFVGRVSASDDPVWTNKRVVGEINAACGSCDVCKQGLGRHCPNRSVLGIQGLDGCLAEFCSLPISNLHIVPEPITDDSAVFIEPLSAAFEILDQVSVKKSDRCVVMGDGKLGILCAWVLSTASDNVTLVGHHADHLELAARGGLKTTSDVTDTPVGVDLVVEATGSEDGLRTSIDLCRPRGTLVLKSTVATQGSLNLAPVVVNELTVVGSRCGRFEKGIAGLVEHRFPVERLISTRYPFDEALAGFEHASRKGALKVVVEIGGAE